MQAGFFQAANSLDPSTEGISQAELMMVMGAGMKKSRELRDAWEAENAQ